MAGDWIKMEMCLARKPEVVGMADRLGLDEFAVVGRLFVVWSWANEQSIDGDAVNIREAYLDRLVNCTGFAAAMRDVGWLKGQDGALEFPNFDRHNGQAAKARSDTAKRVALHRQRRGVTEKCYISNALRAQVYDADSHECVYCGRKEGQYVPTESKSDGRLTVVHVLPESQGGATSLDNLVTCCMRCNREKSDRTPEEAGFKAAFGRYKCNNKSLQKRYQRREEKRREEEKNIPLNPPVGETPDKPATTKPPAISWTPEDGWKNITDADRAEWLAAYPACDLDICLARMTAWLKANPTKARKSNWRRFVTNWLARQQDKGGTTQSIQPGFDSEGARRAAEQAARAAFSDSRRMGAPGSTIAPRGDPRDGYAEKPPLQVPKLKTVDMEIEHANNVGASRVG